MPRLPKNQFKVRAVPAGTEFRILGFLFVWVLPGATLIRIIFIFYDCAARVLRRRRRLLLGLRIRRRRRWLVP